ncbi:uncharacterized protein [Typha angustifolia]|uniref:uncharacterized protein n=1 Tax=Typha angustifolia TaxID=59011 RepID=UPI003C2B155A
MAEIVTSLLGLVFDKLGTKVMTEFAQLMGVDTELKKLESTLSTIQDVLQDAEARQVKERALKSWLRKLKDVAFDIDDVLDEVTTEALQRQQKNKSGMKEKVYKLSSFPKSIMFKSKIARKIKEIRERLDDIAGERSKFHLQERVIAVYKPENGMREQSSSFVIESEVYGRQEDKEKIVDYLTNMSNEIDLGVIVIVGLGGLGKTTVAQLAFNDERVCSQFDEKIWVCVSEDFDIRRICRSIIESVSRVKFDLTDMELMQRSLRENLRGKKFLLVLDDVWNENCEKWDRLRALLTIGSTGSKVMVTTRSKRIASLMGTVMPHLLKGLSEDDCWLLFERKAFGLDSCEKTPNLVGIGKEIVKKCGGVPLAAKALGSLMRIRRRESEWLEIRDNDLWNLSDEETEILPALRLSYNHLPSRLKQCFAYCAIFPKDSVIDKKDLVQFWIAEGFIQSSDRRTDLENIGLCYVDDLISRSLFENAKKFFDDVVRSIRMHDLVHDLAQSVAGEECSIIDTDRRNIAQSTRYSSFRCGHKPTSAILDQLREAKKMRTFYFVNSYRMHEQKDMAQEVVQVVFNSMKLLRVLHFSQYPMKELPASIKNLSHLRYLNLSCGDLETLPPCIGLLHNMQILKLSACGRLQALPDSIGGLSNLISLDLDNCESLQALPDSIGGLSNLSTLNFRYCKSLQALPDSIGGLSNLSLLDLSGCESLQALPDSIGGLSNLSLLDLTSCESLQALPDSIGGLSNLSTLNFRYCKSLQALPDSIGGLSNLSSLNLTYCLSLQVLPDSIGGLSNLSTLNFRYCKSLQALPDSIGGLSNLSLLDLFCCKSLQALPDSIGGLSNLSTLNVCSCKLQALPDSIGDISNLSTLDIRNCESLQADFSGLSNLSALYISHLTYMPSGIGQLSHLQTLPVFVVGGKNNCSLRELSSLNLEGKLYIKNLENVKNVKEAKEANLIQKQGLKALRLSWNLDAYKKPGEANSEKINEDGKTVQEIVEALAVQYRDVDTELIEDVLESLQPHVALAVLKIKQYLGRVFPRWLMELAVPNLEKLTLKGCMRCEILPQFRLLHNLKELELNTLLRVQCLPALGQMRSLRILKLYVLPGIKCLGSEFYGGDGAFPALEELDLARMPELEEWSRTAEVKFLPRLAKLSLVECPKLKALPSDFQSVKQLRLRADDELLLSSLQSGAFRNIKHLSIYKSEMDDELPPVLLGRSGLSRSWSMSLGSRWGVYFSN